jgi:MYXO-CTERM domain-containing protein
MLFGDTVTRWASVGLLSLGLCRCAGPPEGEAIGTSRQAIIAGQVVEAPDAHVLYLVANNLTCTAVLIAPRLVATAHHCVAQSTDGTFTCTPEGELASPGSLAGQIGANLPPSVLTFFTNARVMAGTAYGGAPPDAVGVQTISATSPSACRDDLAFVVLDHAIPGIAPAPVRIASPTQNGEPVSVWGYGLTDQAGDPLALRSNTSAQIVGVGPDAPTDVEQPAPLRAVRVGPGSVTCDGDSGGPIFSAATGAVIAIVSIGSVATQTTTAPACGDDGVESSGPRLAEYTALALTAFAAAGASPILEGDFSDGSPDDGEPPEAEATPTGENPPPDAPRYDVLGGSCSAASGPGDRPGSCGAFALGLALMAATVGRRRRRSS